VGLAGLERATFCLQSNNVLSTSIQIDLDKCSAPIYGVIVFETPTHVSR